jgi:hypothetical protein
MIVRNLIQKDIINILISSFKKMHSMSSDEQKVTFAST